MQPHQLLQPCEDTVASAILQKRTESKFTDLNSTCLQQLRNSTLPHRDRQTAMDVLDKCHLFIASLFFCLHTGYLPLELLRPFSFVFIFVPPGASVYVLAT